MPELHQAEPEEGEWQRSGPEQREPEAREREQAGPDHRNYAEPSVEQPQVAQSSEQDRPNAEPETEPATPVQSISSPAAPRRGSTVREPAPTSFGFGGEPSAPAPAPVAQPEPVPPSPSSGAESEDTTRPRRAGWWSKRVLGKG